MVILLNERANGDLGWDFCFGNLSSKSSLSSNTKENRSELIISRTSRLSYLNIEKMFPFFEAKNDSRLGAIGIAREES